MLSVLAVRPDVMSRRSASSAEPAAGPVLLRAFGDESQRAIAPGESVYVMAAAVFRRIAVRWYVTCCGRCCAGARRCTGETRE